MNYTTERIRLAFAPIIAAFSDLTVKTEKITKPIDDFRWVNPEWLKELARERKANRRKQILAIPKVVKRHPYQKPWRFNPFRYMGYLFHHLRDIF